MILVYLPDSSSATATMAASKAAKYIKAQRAFPCPVCESTNNFLSRKSDLKQRWMELEALCSDCGTRFPVPDNVLRGFWRGENKTPVKVPSGLDIDEEEQDG